MVSQELGKCSFKKNVELAFGAARVVFFPSTLKPPRVHLFHLRLSSLVTSSANGFYIVSDQIFSCLVCNLSSYETHKSTYGPLQLGPVYTFHPH